MYKTIRKILLISLSILCLVGCDYTSKKVAKNKLSDHTVHSYINGNLQFVYVENPGGMLSFGSNLSDKSKLLLFKYSVTLMLVLLFAYTILKKGMNKWMTIAFVLILSGGIGNLIDRFMNDGKVVDFMIIGLYNYHTGIFNVADVYITIGAIGILISSLFVKDHSPTNSIS